MIAIDAMGGDFAPRIPVLGALHVARQGICVALYGDEKKIISILDSAEKSWKKLPITIKHCSETISMFEQPSKAVMRKKDASLVRAARALENEDASALVSAGNSGAVLACGVLIVARVYGVERPAIGQFIPTKKGSIFCLDLGANVDCKPKYLEQFAIIGSEYVRLKKGIENPRVALLSNGVEPYKGSQLVKDSFDLLKSQKKINFVGNLESRYLFDDHADVLVCDGFAGNILLKSIEGTAHFVMYWIGKKMSSFLIGKILSKLIFPFFCRLRKKNEQRCAGGALLLGVNKPIVLAHGASDLSSFIKAIEFAYDIEQKDFVAKLNKRLELQLGGRKKIAIVRKVKSLFKS